MIVSSSSGATIGPLLEYYTKFRIDRNTLFNTLTDQHIFKLIELVLLPYSCESSTHYSNSLHDCSVITPSSVRCQHFLSLWNYMPLEYFCITYD